jgi:para-nitrobenzyl esterase
LFDLENEPLDITTGKRIPLTDAQAVLAKTMIRYWTQFARAGNPNGKGTPHWPRFSAKAAHPQIQVLDSAPREVGPRSDVAVSHQAAFWTSFLR